VVTPSGASIRPTPADRFGLASKDINRAPTDSVRGFAFAISIFVPGFRKNHNSNAIISS
jgi:hypothetical protein